MTQETLLTISSKIIGCAIEVHRSIGPGLLESIYHECLVEELKSTELKVDQQVWIPINYKNKVLKSTLKMDMLINDLIVVEIKAVEVMNPLYKAQLLSYLILSGKMKGLLINFNSISIKDHLVSMVTDEFRKLPIK